jgi:lipoprotein signal peptidase
MVVGCYGKDQGILGLGLGSSSIVMQFSDVFSKKVLAIVIGIITLDLATKYVADWLGWSVINPGVSLGIGSTRSPLILISLGLVSMGLIWQFFWKRILADKNHRTLKDVAFSLWLGGALANMIDRALVGGVRDWIKVPFLAVYNNVADWVFFVGLCMGAWVLGCS